MDFDNIIADKQLWLGKHYTSGRDGHALHGAAVHYNDGNLTHEQCFNTWNGEREASAHFDVDENGSVCQYVHEADTAWAVGDWDGNCETISIEHGNYEDGTISDACLDAGAHLVAALCKKYGLGRPQWDVNVFPHKHYSATSCPGQIYGSQKDAYIQRAQAWYDSMTGGTTASSSPTAPSQPSEPDDKYSLKIDGEQGYYTNLALQEFLRTQKNSDGEICYGTGYKLDGVFGSGTVLALQEFLHAKGFYNNCAMDGDFGYYTKLATQEWLRTERNIYGELCYGTGYKLDGDWGSGSVKALQECLRAKGFYN